MTAHPYRGGGTPGDPYGDGRPSVDAYGDGRPSVDAYGDGQPSADAYGDGQPSAGGRRDGRSSADAYGRGGASADRYDRPAAPRWEATMALRVPEPGVDVLDRKAPDGSGASPAQPQSPAGAGGARPGKTRRVGRLVLVLAVLAAAGGTAAVLLQQEDAAAVASKNLTQAWQISAPAADDALIGSWLTDKLLVRAGSRGGLRAYDLTDGKQVWHAKPSAKDAKHGTVPCAMSPTVNSKGIGTVAFGTDGSTCTWLAGIKASTGKILWSLPLTSAKHPAATTATTFVQGDVATVVSENFLGGVDAGTGSGVWGYRARGHYCNAYDWGAEGVVLVDDFCLDKKNRFTLAAYDGKTGNVIWRKTEKAHSDVPHILSGSPLIASVHTANQDAVRVFDSTGSGRKLAVGNDELTSGNDTTADHSARLYGNVLVTPASSAGVTAVDGFDTTTGAKLWSEHSVALAVPADGADGAVYAVTTSGPRQLVTIDRRTGRTTPVAGLPTGTGKWNFTSGTVYVTADGGVLELNALGSNGGVRLYR
ncbi:PQQ-binding-like beta-propeller repeat protein [Streptomyces mangrovisoli]|uniref:outer membrane protein assembly factor BamB family protein n=1 Tax=Streptomyces mangrovisoli TaxID=1428628 RepID=UPI00142E1AA0|nr:PQQ-binding-like beta-propeller repeat protein [Streptomyces mangrovisoli]